MGQEMSARRRLSIEKAGEMSSAYRVSDRMVPEPGRASEVISEGPWLMCRCLDISHTPQDRA